MQQKIGKIAESKAAQINAKQALNLFTPSQAGYFPL